MQLSRASLETLPARIRRPAQDPAGLSAGILHVGVGNFHRAHQAVYLDEWLATGAGSDWGILGAGVMPADAAMRSDLAAQDWLYTVVEQDRDVESVRVAGSLTGFLPLSPGHSAMVAAMADPAIRIVSLTVTEGGYFVDSGGAFDAGHPEILADAAAPEAPRTVFGAITAGLRARRAAGAPPLTVLSCDNVPHNGDVARAAVVGLAEQQDAGLGRWIADRVTFPNSMVDRITPGTSAARRRDLAARFGVEDRRPVFCESFRQWVVEDRFAAGRPSLERVGVQFVADVTPWELMKIRILNGGHAVIAYPAGLLGLEYAHAAMAHPLISGFLDRVGREEIIPVTPPVPDTSLADYARMVARRFANPRIADTVRRLCFDGSNRQPKFIVPSIRDNLARGGRLEGLLLVSALWCRYCHGTRDDGGDIAANDPAWEALQARARAAREAPERWLEMHEVYGELGREPLIRAAFAKALSGLWTQGVEATLRSYLDRPA